MDVSTSIHNDPKFKALARRYPDLAAPALAAYIVLLAESWREGRRLTLEDAWSLFPFDEGVATALKAVGLVDAEYRVPAWVWDSHFGGAFDRRQTGRDRQRRADIRRGRTKADADVAPRTPDGPTVRTDSQTYRSTVGPALDPHRNRGDAEDTGVCPGCGQPVSLSNPSTLVRAPMDGRLWHMKCPAGPWVGSSGATA